MKSSALLAIGRRIHAVALACALGLSGCGGGGSGTTSTAPSTSAGAYTLAVDPHPLQAVAVLDTARAATADVPLTGGTVAATGADGTVYTLTVPDRALSQPTTIRITPIQSLDVPGLGAERYFAAKFEPEGLLFLTPATLEITPPSGTAAPVDQQIPLTWSGTSAYVTLGLVDKTSPLMRQQVDHFSHYGYALASKGTSASLAGARQRLGGAAEDRIRAAAAEALGIERQKELLGVSSDEQASLNDLLTKYGDLQKEYIDQVIRVRLNAAGNSCANARLATQTYLGFQRQAALMGIQDPLPADLDAQAIQVMNDIGPTVCMKEEFELCRDEHIVTRILPEFFGALRQNALLGGDGDRFDSVLRGKLRPYVEKCLRFDISMTSSVDYNAGQGSDVHTFSEKASTVMSVFWSDAPTSLIPLDSLPPDFAAGIAATGLITGPYVTLTTSDYQVYYQNSCYDLVSKSPVNGLAGALYFGFTAKKNPNDPTKPPDLATRAQVDDFVVAPSFQPPISSHLVNKGYQDPDTGGCKYPNPPETVADGWNGAGAGLLLSDGAKAAGTIYPELRQWQVGTGAVMGTKDLDITSGDTSEKTHLTAHFEIRHTPAAQ